MEENIDYGREAVLECCLEGAEVRNSRDPDLSFALLFYFIFSSSPWTFISQRNPVGQRMDPMDSFL